MRVGSVNISSNGEFSNETRLEDMFNVLNTVKADLFVFPAGFFSVKDKEPYGSYGPLSFKIRKALDDETVTVGFDGQEQKHTWPKDQTTLAINSGGIIGAARKFFPTAGEKGKIITAKGPYEREYKHSRLFCVDNKLAYMAVCYDSFGLRKKSVPNHGASLITNHIHAFFPKEEGNSSDTYFVRHGLAGAAKVWDCPIVAAGVFFRRDVPKNWQAGVRWNKGDMSTMYWKYADNTLAPVNDVFLHTGEGYMRILSYDL